MVKEKINKVIVAIIFIGFVSNVSALIYSGVATINTVNKLGFDFIDQVACTTNGSYNGCHTNFYIAGGGPWTPIISNNGYGAKMGQVNLDSLKTAPAATVFAETPGTIDDIPFDSLSFRVGCSYWIKTGPDDGIIFYAKIRILSFPIMDSIKPETAMTFLYALNAAGLQTCVTSGLDTFHLPYYPTGVLPPDAPSAHKTVAFSTPGQLVFKVAGDRFILPEELTGTSGYVSIFSLSGKNLGKIALTGKPERLV